MRATWHYIKARGMVLFTVYLLLCLTLLQYSAAVSYAIDPNQKQLFKRSVDYVDFSRGTCDTSSGSSVTASQSQADNAKIVIGIAKTYNLGKQGALIGLMTALTESRLRNYANSGIPISMENPAWLALPEPRPKGSDHDSVGIMQQRVSTGWSTFGNYGNNAETNKNVTWQLMDPAYAAQAFFGTPPGAQLPTGLKQPSALKKGLQNVEGWQSMDPGTAAQKVQISAFPDAYNKNRSAAQALLNQYWDEAPAIPLPIPITGGTANTPSTTCGAGGKTGILQKIFEYAWPDYRPAGTAGATIGKDAYVTAIRAADAKGEYIGDRCHGATGVDCGAFVTRVMRDSGADPEYNKNSCDTACQLLYLRKAASQGKYKKVSNSEPLQAGDIAIKDGHTYFYVGKMTGPNGEAFNGDAASASQCQRAPMAGPNDTRSDYEWYRLN